jgi:DNA invertase Pin-like site-specific DNA recombinase
VNKRQANTAALYCRLSRDDGGDAESNSIVTQRMMLQRYAKEHGFVVKDEYIDDGVSGTTFERESLKRMLTDIEEGKVSVVLCKDLSRFGRNNALVAYYTEIYFIEHNVRFIAINDGIDTSLGDNEIMPFKSVINEFYARDISKKVRSAMKTHMLNGEHISGSTPYGYKLNPLDNRKFVVDEEAATVIRRIFSMATDGLSPRNIATRLFKDSVLTPSALEYQRTGRKHVKFVESQPYSWSGATVNKILRNPVYLGHMVNHRQANKSFKNKSKIDIPRDEWIIVEDMHTPIIDSDTFEKVQKLISVKKRENKRRLDNIFCGIVFCADCGIRLVYSGGAHCKGGMGGFTCGRYRHSAFAGMERRCTPHNIGFQVLYEYMKDAIKKVINETVDQDKLLKILNNQASAKGNEPQKELDSLKRRHGELKRLVKNAFEQNSLGRLEGELFADLVGGYQSEYKDVAARIEAIDAKLNEVTDERANTLQFIERIKSYTEMEELTREILLDLVDKIVVHEPEVIGRERKHKIDIYFRFIGKLPE